MGNKFILVTFDIENGHQNAEKMFGLPRLHDTCY